jgi:hypothetical protein
VSVASRIGAFVGSRKSGAPRPPVWNFVSPSTTGGFITVVIPDGKGGWYVAGTFPGITDAVATYTTGYARLVRLRPNGTVDPAFSCPVSGRVRSLALDATGLYIFGDFNGANSVGTATRNYVARVRPFDDPSPGAVDAWRPDANAAVYGGLLDGTGRLFMWGSFTQLGGAAANFVATARSCLGCVTTGATATLNTWAPSSNATVWTMTADWANGKLYGGGQTSTVDGQPRLCAFRVTTSEPATLDSWRPDCTGGIVTGIYLDALNSKAYLLGTLTGIGGAGSDNPTAVSRLRVARVSTGSTATVDPWRPDANGPVYGFIPTPQGAIMTGEFGTIGGTGADIPTAQTRSRVALVTLGATATLDAFNPSATGAFVWTGVYASAFGKALLVGDFSALASHVDSIGNDIAVVNV